MSRILHLILVMAPILWLGGCNLAENGDSDPVFSCDASGTVAEICIEEPALPSTQQASKSTCLSAKGTWSDTKRCPSSYAKKCEDAKAMNYYYAKSDGSKSCSELVFLLKYTAL